MFVYSVGTLCGRRACERLHLTVQLSPDFRSVQHRSATSIFAYPSRRARHAIVNKHASHTLGVKTAIVSSRREKYFSEACATLGLLSTNLRMDGVDVVLGRQLLCVSAQINLYIECNLMHPDETELKNLLIDGLQGNSGAYRLYLIKLSSLAGPGVEASHSHPRANRAPGVHERPARDISGKPAEGPEFPYADECWDGSWCDTSSVLSLLL